MDETGLRHAVLLPLEDIEYLNARGLVWETLIEDKFRWVLLHKFPIPEGYNVTEADIAIKLSESYPSTPLDMVYVFPALYLLSEEKIKATDVLQALDGRSFQRWSRHRTPTNPWRPNVDYLATHIGLVEEWFSRELTKNV